MAINCSIYLLVMAAVAIGKKLTKTGSIFMGRGRAGASWRGMGSGSRSFKGLGKEQAYGKVDGQGQCSG